MKKLYRVKLIEAESKTLFSTPETTTQNTPKTQVVPATPTTNKTQTISPPNNSTQTSPPSLLNRISNVAGAGTGMLTLPVNPFAKDQTQTLTNKDASLTSTKTVNQNVPQKKGAYGLSDIEMSKANSLGISYDKYSAAKKNGTLLSLLQQAGTKQNLVQPKLTEK